jgi:hypothetical protein
VSPGSLAMVLDRCIIFDASDKKLGLGILRRRGNYRYISRHPKVPALEERSQANQTAIRTGEKYK